MTTTSQVLNLKTKRTFDNAMTYFTKFHTRALNEAIASGDFTKVRELDYFKDIRGDSNLKELGEKILNNEMEIASIFVMQSLEDLSVDEMKERILTKQEISGGNEDDMIAYGDNNQQLNDVVAYLLPAVQSILVPALKAIDDVELSFALRRIVDSKEYKSYLHSFGFDVKNGHSEGALSNEEQRSWDKIEEVADINYAIARSLIPIANAIRFYANKEKDVDMKSEETQSLLVRMLVSPVICRECYCCGRSYYIHLGFKDWKVTDAPYKANFMRVPFCSMKKSNTPFEFGSTITSKSGKLVLHNDFYSIFNHPDFRDRFNELKHAATLPPSSSVNDVLGARIYTEVMSGLMNVGILHVTADVATYEFSRDDNNSLTITASKSGTNAQDEDKSIELNTQIVGVVDMDVLKYVVGSDLNSVLKDAIIIDAPVGTYHISTQDVDNDTESFVQIKKISSSTESVVKSDAEVLDSLGIVSRGYDSMVQVRLGKRGARI